MAGQNNGRPDSGYFTIGRRPSRITSPGGTIIVGSAPPNGHMIQIVMPPGGTNQGQRAGFRISMSSGQGASGGGSSVIVGGTSGGGASSVVFSTLPRRVVSTQRSDSVDGGLQEVRRVRRIHSSDDVNPWWGRATFSTSTPHIEEHVYQSVYSNPGVESSRVMISSPVHETNVYQIHPRVVSPPTTPPVNTNQNAKQVMVHKIHLLPSTRHVHLVSAAKDEHNHTVTKQSDPVAASSGSQVSVSASVGVGANHDSSSHVQTQSTRESNTDGSVSSGSSFPVLVTSKEIHQVDQQRDADNSHQLLDETIAENMRRFMAREGRPNDQIGYVSPTGSQRNLPVITITHRRKPSVEQPSDFAPAEVPMTPDEKRDLFRKFKFRFGSIGDFAGSDGSGRSGSGGGSDIRGGRPDAFYFQDFDDLASRIRVLWSNRVQKPTRGESNLSASHSHRQGELHRPKSFLRDEMDEFDRVFSELLFSPRSRTSSSLSQDSRWASFDRVVEEFESEATDLRVNSASCFSAGAMPSGCNSSEHTPTKCSPRRRSGSPSVYSPKNSTFSSPPGRFPRQRHSSADEPDDSSHEKFSQLCDRSDKLFADLLDDLDNLSGDSASVRRRRRARDMFSDWLFGNASISSHQGPLLLGDRPMLRRNRAGVDRKQQITKRRSADFSDAVSRPGFYTRWRRPRSTELYAEDDADSGYHTGNSTLQAVAAAARDADSTALSREELRHHILAFNNNHHGLIMTLDPQSETFQGFIRVHLNLIRPINMSVSGRPPSFYEAVTHDTVEGGEGGEGEEHITSFYLPKNTTKVVHISSETTTEQVIRALLDKYNITDNPRKFALYQKTDHDGKVSMQRLSEDKCPLPLCLSWTAEGLDSHMFVLQENDTGEIIWEAFSLPELENFRKILDREESEYVEQVKAKYHLLKLQMTQRLKHMDIDPSTDGDDDKRQPVFV